MKTNNQHGVKKDVGTLSNPLSGSTKQGGINSQDDTKLQIERSASLLVDNQLHVDKFIEKQSFLKFIKKNYKLDPQGLYYKLIKELEKKRE